MKKLFIILAMVLPIVTFAHPNIKTSNENLKNEIAGNYDRENGYIIYHEYRISSEEITLPLVVQAPAPPSGTLLSISGPISSNITNWNITNGILTIIYTENNEIMTLEDPGTYYIETPVSPQPHAEKNYAIRFIVE